MTDTLAVWPKGAPVVGQRAERSRVIGPRDIELFTAISGDRNPLHYDAERAARTRFGGIVVQGGITSAILNSVVAEDLPGPGTVFLNVNWNFKAPVSFAATAPWRSRARRSATPYPWRRRRRGTWLPGGLPSRGRILLHPRPDCFAPSARHPPTLPECRLRSTVLPGTIRAGSALNCRGTRLVSELP